MLTSGGGRRTRVVVLALAASLPLIFCHSSTCHCLHPGNAGRRAAYRSASRATFKRVVTRPIVEHQPALKPILPNRGPFLLSYGPSPSHFLPHGTPNKFSIVKHHPKRFVRFSFLPYRGLGRLREISVPLLSRTRKNSYHFRFSLNGGPRKITRDSHADQPRLSHVKDLFVLACGLGGCPTLDICFPM